MPTLYEKTLKLFQSRPNDQTLSKVAKDTGLKFDWLSAFAQGKISDPSVNKVQKLYEYLTNSTLKV